MSAILSRSLVPVLPGSYISLLLCVFTVLLFTLKWQQRPKPRHVCLPHLLTRSHCDFFFFFWGAEAWLHTCNYTCSTALTHWWFSYKDRAHTASSAHSCSFMQLFKFSQIFFPPFWFWSWSLSLWHLASGHFDFNIEPCKCSSFSWTLHCTGQEKSSRRVLTHLQQMTCDYRNNTWLCGW